MCDLLSGLQKSVRRGLRTEAAWACASILPAFVAASGDGDAPMKTKARAMVTNLVHRLMVMFLEDVHAADPNLWPRVCELARACLSLHEKRRARERPVEEFAYHLFRLADTLAAAFHSRAYSHLREAVRQEALDNCPPPLGLVVDHIRRFGVTPNRSSKGRVLPAVHTPGVDIGFWSVHIPAREKWLVGAAAQFARAVPHLRYYGSDTYDTTPLAPLASLNIREVPAFFLSPVVLDCHVRRPGCSSAHAALRFALLGSAVANERSVLVPSFLRRYTVARCAPLANRELVTLANVLGNPECAAVLASASPLADAALFSTMARSPEVAAYISMAFVWGFPVLRELPFAAGGIPPPHIFLARFKGTLAGLKPMHYDSLRTTASAAKGGEKVAAFRMSPVTMHDDDLTLVGRHLTLPTLELVTMDCDEAKRGKRLDRLACEWMWRHFMQVPTSPAPACDVAWDFNSGKHHVISEAGMLSGKRWPCALPGDLCEEMAGRIRRAYEGARDVFDFREVLCDWATAFEADMSGIVNDSWGTAFARAAADVAATAESPDRGLRRLLDIFDKRFREPAFPAL